MGQKDGWQDIGLVAAGSIHLRPRITVRPEILPGDPTSVGIVSRQEVPPLDPWPGTLPWVEEAISMRMEDVCGLARDAYPTSSEEPVAISEAHIPAVWI